MSADTKLSDLTNQRCHLILNPSPTVQRAHAATEALRAGLVSELEELGLRHKESEAACRSLEQALETCKVCRRSVSVESGCFTKSFLSAARAPLG